MNRTPPVSVVRALRKEVGFGCPVENCGNPYLEWHHFDPPWAECNHHNPEGMIALCRMHHIQADNGAFTLNQLQRLKQKGRENWGNVSERFNWMRNELVFVVSNYFVLEPKVFFRYQNKPLIWFERNEDGMFMVNFYAFLRSPDKRFCIDNNVWYLAGCESDVVCPPAGKYLNVEYDNGDKFEIKFKQVSGVDEAISSFGSEGFSEWGINYPVTFVELVVKGPGTIFDNRGGIRSVFDTKGGFFERPGVVFNVMSDDYY
ncbi:conserved hypothetical protein [Hahella chejuensis KCTC 2396]|uniref:HNH nuclease domain-containing protein n=1 Tax=Hahella chejuensis (strain KCTC 2396) TaxID=349521 RepID=Q2SJJ3_HAHCH|nr:HNH endonuclease [Hahella chejuensis]ABC29181.1 conserved hypothetical protein [Hahella chejuensis KCTC 2396]